MSSSVLYDQISHSIFSQINPSSAFPLVSLVVSVMFIFLLLDKTSSQPKPQSLSSSVIPAFNEDIATTLLIHINTLSLPISHFFITLLYSIPPTLPVLMSYLYTFFIPSRISHLYLRLLHLDHYRFILVTHIMTSSLWLSSVDLLIAIRKGTHSPRNPHLIYNFLDYLAFIFTIFYFYFHLIYCFSS